MHAMRHPNVIQLYGASLKPPHLCLVLEFAPYGSLEDALQGEGAPKNTTAWRERLLTASDIMKGLKYLHSRKVLRLDIKSGNVMLFEHKSRRLAKLVDFGLAFIKNETSAAGTVAVKTNAELETARAVPQRRRSHASERNLLIRVRLVRTREREDSMGRRGAGASRWDGNHG